MEETVSSLLERICSDDDVIAYRQLVEGYVDRAYGLAFRLVGVRSLAEELVEKALVATWRCRKACPWKEFEFRLWLYREVVTQGISRCGLLSVHPYPVGMPVLHRLALTLIYFPDMDAEKVAAVLDVTKEAVECLLAEGRRMLRKQLIVGR